MNRSDLESPLNILIAGYYGSRNAGDELILSGLIDFLISYHPQVRLRVVSHRPGLTQALHGVEAVAWDELAKLEDAVSRSDLVILGGGGLLHDYWPVHSADVLTARQAGLSQYASPLVMARAHGRRTAMLGVGVGPIRTSEGLYLSKEILALAGHVVVRDRDSLGRVASLGVPQDRAHLGIDLALLSPEVSVDQAIAEAAAVLPRPLLGVSVRSWDMERRMRVWADEAAQALLKWRALTNGSILFLPMQEGETFYTDDRAASEALVDMMGSPKNVIIAPLESDPFSIFGAVGLCDYVLGMRLHSVVAAVKHGIPCLAIGYDPKVKSAVSEIAPSVRVADFAEITSSFLAQELTRLEDKAGQARAAAERLTTFVKRSSQTMVQVLDMVLAEPAPAPGLVGRVALTRAMELDSKSKFWDQFETRYESLRRGSWATLKENRRLANQIRQLESQERAIEGSKGWRLLSLAWRLIWSLRSGQDWLRKLRRMSAGIIDRMVKFYRELLPMSMRRAAYLARSRSVDLVDNTQVVSAADSWSADEWAGGVLKNRGRSSGVSLIATVLNEAVSVEGWFERVGSQTRLPDEIVIVDAGSDDGTYEKLMEEAAGWSGPVTVERLPGCSRSEGRNHAVALATRDLIALTDFGCLPRDDWLEKLIDPFQRSAVQVVAGFYEHLSNWALSSYLVKEIIPSKDNLDRSRFLPSGRSMGIRRSSWDAVGGMPEWLPGTGEDTFFDLQLKRYGGDWALAAEAIVQWIPPRKIADFWSLIVENARGDGQSGAFAAQYWKRFQALGLLGLGAFVLAGGLFAVTPNITIPLLIVSLAGMVLLAAVASRAAGGRQIHDVPLILFGQLGRSVGFIKGVQERPSVICERYRDVRGVTFILTGVPMDDTGGGSRGAQLANEFLERGDLVVFIHRYQRNESYDLGIDPWHENLIHLWHVGLDEECLLWELDRVLEAKRIRIVVEFPLEEFRPLISRLKQTGAAIIYERIDLWESELGGSWFDPAVESEIISLAHILTATAAPLKSKVEMRAERPVHLLPNGFSEGIFRTGRTFPRPADLPAADFIMVYAGALWGGWFDWELVRGIARAYPQAAILLIGDDGRAPEMEEENIFLLGLKGQSELPAYYSYSDLCVLPWKQDALSAATSPIKAYEAIACELPVLSFDLPALRGLPLVSLVTDRNEFISMIPAAINVSATDVRMKRFLSENSWKARVDELERLVARADRWSQESPVRQTVVRSAGPEPARQ